MKDEILTEKGFFSSVSSNDSRTRLSIILNILNRLTKARKKQTLSSISKLHRFTFKLGGSFRLKNNEQDLQVLLKKSMRTKNSFCVKSQNQYFSLPNSYNYLTDSIYRNSSLDSQTIKTYKQFQKLLIMTLRKKL